MVLVSSASEILSTAVASFLLGWTLKNYRIGLTLSNFLRVKPLANTKLVIVVRSDLPLSKGKLAAQCSHAAVSCYRQAMKKYPGILESWVSAGEPKIIVRSDSPGEESLKRLAKKAANAGLVAVAVRDAGRTQIPMGTMTVVGIGPGCANEINEVTSHLKLL